MSTIIYLIPSSRVLLDKLISPQLVKNLSFFWNLKVHCRVHKSSPPILILSKTKPFHVTSSCSLSYILILSSHLRLGLSSGLYPLGFDTEILYAPLLSYIRVTCQANFIVLGLIARIIFGEQYRS